MIHERLRVFVSSGMQELAPERAAIRQALAELHIEGWVFEEDAGARAQTITQTYRQEIDGADLYVGLFWRNYGDYTIDEFDYATEQGKERLIYEKRVDVEGRRDPRLQAFLDRIGKVETGLTTRWFDSPEELGEGVKRDLARWQTEKVRQLRESNVRYRPRPVESVEHRGLLVLLTKVRHFWVEGVLDRNIRNAELLELDKDAQPQAVDNPWEAVLDLPFEGSRPVASGKGIAEVFDDLEHSVLILGQPGSGKTTTLLMLVRELIRRAERDPGRPIPVVFHLSSWVDPSQPLETWLVDEMHHKYQIPKRIAQGWLQHHRLVLLLDGLDEVAAAHRDACVRAINGFAREVGLPGLAVCCRLEQYEELPVKLGLNGAICLRPLTDEQIASYVDEEGAQLAGLGAALRGDGVLRELARSPLMLNLMCLAYRGSAPEELVGRDSAEQRSEHLFTTYIEHVFRNRSKASLAFPREQTLGWLSRIAGRMSERNQTMFLIEDLQPSWLSTGAQRWGYRALLCVVLGFPLAGINILYWWNSFSTAAVGGMQVGEPLLWLTAMPLWVLAFAWAEDLGSGSGRAVLERLAPGIPRAAAKALVGAVLWLPVMLMAKWFWAGSAEEQVMLHLFWGGLPIVLYVGAIGRNRSIMYSIDTVESLRLSLRPAWKGLLLGLVGGLVVGGLVYILPDYEITDPLLFTVGFATVGAGLGAMLGGLTPYVVDTKTRPNHGMRLSFKTALLMGANTIWLTLIAVIFGFLTGILPDMEWLLRVITVLGGFLYLFTALFLWFGGLDVLKHYALRAVLTVSGQTPWNLARLLEQVRGLHLMQRVGNAYIFVHRRLLEHLAGTATGAGLRAARETRT